MKLTYRLPASQGLAIHPGEWVEVLEAYQVTSNRKAAQVVSLRVRSRSMRFKPDLPTGEDLIRLRPHEGKIAKIYPEADHLCFTISFY